MQTINGVIAKIINEVRDEKGLTYQQLGDMVGKDKSTIHSDLNKPKSNKYDDMLNALGLEITYNPKSFEIKYKKE